jgi:ankyrin repeat protein
MSQRTVSLAVLQSYLEYRVRNEPAEGNLMLNCIRRLATDIHRERPKHDPELPTIEACAQRLCSVLITFADGLEHTNFENRHAARRFREIFIRRAKVTEDEYEGLLLSAGICTNACTVVQRCITKSRRRLAGMKFYNNENIFQHPLQLAAEYGNLEVLQCLMTTSEFTIDQDVRNSLFVAAATNGHIEAVQFLYEFKRIEIPWQFGQSSYELERNALDECLDTPSLEVWDFVHELRAIYAMPSMFIYPQMNSSLRKALRAGNSAMVQELLKRGAYASKYSEWYCQLVKEAPIDEACKGGLASIYLIELLIKHGADPNATVAAAASKGQTTLVQQLLDRGITPVRALSTAAAGPYFDIVRLLLDASVDVNEDIGSRSPLASAIGVEHTELFKYLLGHGADLHTPGTAEECVKRAKTDGLESMLCLLKEHGVDVDDAHEKEAVDNSV